MKRADVAADRVWLFHCALIFANLGLLLASRPSFAQSNATTAFHPNSSFAAESLLRNAARHVAEKQWPEAIDLYLRVIGQHGDAVARVPAPDGAADQSGTSQLFVNARRYCQGVLAALPPDGLAHYRQRVDARAEQLFLEAERTGDRQALSRVVDEFFASRWGDQAVDLLGDLEFRAGRFREALQAYHRLVADPQAPPTVVYPDSDVDGARVAAKILLCRAAIGTPPSEIELQAYSAAYPDLKGMFAGRSGPLGTSLQSAIAEDDWPSHLVEAHGWPAFAGAENRNGVRSEKIDVGSFQWKIDLPPPEPARVVEPEEIRFGGGFRTPPLRDAEPSTFPIIVGDRVMIADDSRVQSFRLDVHPKASGDDEVRKEVLFWDSPYTPPYSTSGRSSSQAPPRYALSTSGDRVFARLGSTGRGTSGGILYAVRSNDEVEGKLIWRKPASDIALPVQNAGEHHLASYEGAPTADADHVYVALTESATEPWVYVACLDAETGTTIWVRHLGSGAPSFDPMRPIPTGPTIGNRMLSLDGGLLYYQTNLGAVACLEAETGAVRWVATYPVIDRNAPANNKRAPNPALVAEGLVIVAPEDAPAVFAFDSLTGRLAWKTEAVPDLQHLLGVAQGKLFATGNHLFTFDARTGKPLRVWPEAGGRFDGYGRGVLAGGMVYWPTRTEILVVDQATGGDMHATIPLFQTYGFGGGNLAVGNGYLAVAQRERLIIYSQTRRVLEQFRQRLADSSRPAVDHLELAKLAEAAGETDLALESLDQALARAREGDTVEGRPLAQVARERRQRLLVRLGDESIDNRQWQEAAEYFRKARAIASNAREVLSTQLKLAGAFQSLGQPEAAVQALQQVLEDSQARVVIHQADAQRRVRAEVYVAEQVRKIVERAGPAVYADYERKAQQLFARGRQARDVAVLRETIRSYPASVAASDALLSLAQLLQSQEKRMQALDAYEELLSMAADDERRALALVSIGELHASMGQTLAARAGFEQAARKFGDVSLRAFGREETVGEVCVRRLSSLAPQVEAPVSTKGAITPLVLTGELGWQFDARPFAIGVGSSGHARLLIADATRLSLIEPTQAQPLWIVESGLEPTWVVAQDNLILVGGGGRLCALNERDGSLAWRFDPLSDEDEGLASPFAHPDVVAVPFNTDVMRTAAVLDDFRLDAGRVSMVRDEREVVTVDARDGRFLWAYTAPLPARGAVTPSRINPHRWADGRRHMVEVLPDHVLTVLDARNGATIATCNRGDGALPLRRRPVRFDEDRLVLAPDARSIALLDIDRGKIVWEYTDQAALPRELAPSIWCAGESLLALFGGEKLVRIDAVRGERIWEHQLGLADLAGADDALLLDDDRFYIVLADRCEARLTATGEVVWRRPLNQGRTPSAVGQVGPWVVAYPSASRLNEGGAVAFELIVCDRHGGAQRQRIAIERPADRLATDLNDAEVVIATQSHAWVFERPRPTSDR